MAESAKLPRYWLGSPPTDCQICASPLTERFFDARTWHGSWAMLCPSCQENGPGLNQIGHGRGQEYELQADGRWMKVAG